jgi:hypothetical protein
VMRDLDTSLAKSLSANANPLSKEACELSNSVTGTPAL